MFAIKAPKSGYRKQLKIILESFKQHFTVWALEVRRQLQFLKILYGQKSFKNSLKELGDGFARLSCEELKNLMP